MTRQAIDRRRLSRDDAGGSSGPGNVSGELYGGSSGSSPGDLANSVNSSTGPGNVTGELYNSGGGSSGPGASDDDFDLGAEVEAFLADKLSPEDMDTLIGLFNRDIGYDPNDSDDAGAMDGKLKLAADAAYETKVKAHRKALYEAGQITLDHYRSPIIRPPSEAEQRAQDQRRREMFGPNYDRLRG